MLFIHTLSCYRIQLFGLSGRLILMSLCVNIFSQESERGGGELTSD